MSLAADCRKDFNAAALKSAPKMTDVGIACHWSSASKFSLRFVAGAIKMLHCIL